MTEEPKVEQGKEGYYSPNILPILKWPNDDRLHDKSVEITDFGFATKQLAYDLLHTMKAAKGVGLSAPQTGNMVNMIVVCIEEPNNIVLINPVILETSEELFEFNEGCLSVPGFFEDRKRPKKIVVQFNDLEGSLRQFEFYDLYAFCIQHEMDHLNGKLFVDGSSSLKKARIISRMKKVAKRK
jgi:peptide deformylase